MWKVVATVIILLIVSWIYYIGSHKAGGEEHEAGVYFAKELNETINKNPTEFGQSTEVRYEASRNRVHLNVHGWDRQRNIAPVIAESERLLKNYPSHSTSFRLTITFKSVDKKNIAEVSIKGK